MSLSDIVTQSSGLPFDVYLDLFECMKKHCELCLEYDSSHSVVILKDAVVCQFGKCR